MPVLIVCLHLTRMLDIVGRQTGFGRVPPLGMRMAKIHLEDVFDATPERLCEVMTQPEHFAKWMQGVLSIEPMTELPVRHGSRWRETRKMFGKPASEVFEIAAFDPPLNWTVFCDGRNGAMKKGEMTFEYHLMPEGGRTRVVIDCEISKLGWFGDLMMGLFKGQFVRMLKSDFDGVRAYLRTNPA